MLTSVRHLSFSPFEEGRPPFVEACIGVLATQLFGTSTGGREGVSTCSYKSYQGHAWIDKCCFYCQSGNNNNNKLSLDYYNE